MNKRDQARLVRDLCNGLKREMLARLPGVPEEWDGHELRQWMADLADELYRFRDLGPRRKRDYNNTRATRNL